ncbi:MAG TPA: hypothetical protein VNT81_06515, partial [Vicinamibacterales bacterium]|nr:hypothetical protein [Vicinamibacterales bacterium]
ERVNPATAPEALSRVSELCDRFVGFVQRADSLNSSAREAAVTRYRDEHLQDERMRSMLAHIFGEATAGTLMNNVLFPPELVDDVCA